VGLFTLADDFGRMRYLPKQIAGALFPHEDHITGEIVASWIDELVSEDAVRLYEIDGRTYLYLPGWSIHQKISKPTPSRIPDPPENPQGNPGKPRNHQGEVGSRNLELGIKTSRDSRSSDDSSRITSPIASLSAGRQQRSEAYEAEFAQCWEIYPRKESRKAALGAFKARRREKVSLEDLLRATKIFAVAMTGKESNFIMHGSRFFGPNEEWREYLEERKSAAVGGFVDPPRSW
jgi:hypothetical protein